MSVIAFLDLNLQSWAAEEINNTYFTGTAWGGCTHIKRNWKNIRSMGARKAICRGSVRESMRSSKRQTLPKSRACLTQQHMWHKPHERRPAFSVIKTAKTSRHRASRSNSMVTNTHWNTLVEGEHLNCNKHTENHSGALNSKSNVCYPKLGSFLSSSICLCLKYFVRSLCLAHGWKFQAEPNKSNVTIMMSFLQIGTLQSQARNNVRSNVLMLAQHI